MSTWFPEVDLPTLPVVDLITGRPGSSEEEVVSSDMHSCQIRWDFPKIYRLELDRRSALCTLLVRLLSKSPDLKGSDSHKLWERVAKDPSWPDTVMEDAESSEDED